MRLEWKWLYYYWFLWSMLECTAAIGVGIDAARHPSWLQQVQFKFRSKNPAIASLSRSFAEKKGLTEDDPDDILMQSFYEREWKKKQSPPLPIKEGGHRYFKFSRFKWSNWKQSIRWGSEVMCFRTHTRKNSLHAWYQWILLWPSSYKSLHCYFDCKPKCTQWTSFTFSI